MENLSVYERYPTKSSNCITRDMPSSRISFAAGTKFNNRFERRLSEMIKRSTYSIKPTRREKDTITRYRAPAATIPVGPYESVTHRDYVYPSNELLRAMNPTPKWIYRSRSDLGAGRILDHDYQYFNSGRSSTNSGEKNESRNESKMSDTNQENDTARSSVIQSNNNANGIYVSPNLSKEFPNSEGDESYTFYKPLVGDSRDRYIENAFMKRAVEGEEVIPFKIDNRKHPFVPRQIRFTDSLNRAGVPRADNIARLPRKLPGLIRRNTFDVSGDRNETIKGPEMSNIGNKRVTLYNKAPAALSLNNDMTRTYEKQARLKEMLQK